jgi:myo-inositol 2-dehydrogenase/D-chiro-inositol 1-dehydrogenase
MQCGRAGYAKTKAQVSARLINLALFGAGRIGCVHAANIAADTERVKLVYVFDTNAAAASAAAARYGAMAAPSVDTVFGDATIDAVLVASSTNTHVELIMAAVEAGKAVLCEKPIDLDIARVEHCKRVIANSGVPVQIGFNRRFDRSHRAVRDAVKAGDIGALELLVITSRDPALAPLSYLQVSGGLFRDMTIHDFDLARFILGDDPIHEVYATGSALVDPALGQLGDIDTAMVIMKTAAGALVHINNSRRAVYGYDQRVEAFGSKGMVQSDNLRASTLCRYDARSTDVKEPLLHFFIDRYRQAYVDELSDFIDAVAKHRAPSVDFEDGRLALILADAALESASSGKTIVVSFA